MVYQCTRTHSPHPLPLPVAAHRPHWLLVVHRYTLAASSFRAAQPALCGCIKLSVGGTCPSYLLEIGGLLTQGRRRRRTVGEPVGGILKMDSSDWSNRIRYHIFDTRLDTEFKSQQSRNNRPGPAANPLVTSSAERAPARSTTRASHMFPAAFFYTHCKPTFLKLSVVWYRIYGIESRSTNQNCPLRESHRPTRRQSDRVVILEQIDPRFRGSQRDRSRSCRHDILVLLPLPTLSLKQNGIL